MISAENILEFLNLKFPFIDACDFDNVGLLIGSEQTKSEKVLVALDCDINAVNKAAELGASIIVTHHPVIFSGLKRVTDKSVVKAVIENKITVISAHTNFDQGKGGLNDILCERLGIVNYSKFTASDGYILNSGEVNISNPDLLAKDIKSRLLCPVKYVAGRPIKRVLICSGSGGDFITDAYNNGFDGLITADVKHNYFIDALNYGISLFDAGHYATENICVEPLCEMLQQKFPDTKFISFEPDLIRFTD